MQTAAADDDADARPGGERQQSVYGLVCEARDGVAKVLELHLNECGKLRVETTIVHSAKEEIAAVLDDLVAAVPPDKEAQDFLFLPSDDVAALRHYTSDLKGTLAAYKDKLARAEQAYKELFARLNRRDTDIAAMRSTLYKEVCQAREKLAGRLHVDTPPETSLFDTFTGMEVEMEELHQKHAEVMTAKDEEHRRYVEKLKARYELMLKKKDKELISRQLEFRNAAQSTQVTHKQLLEEAQNEVARLKDRMKALQESMRKELETEFRVKMKIKIDEVSDGFRSEIRRYQTELTAANTRCFEAEQRADGLQARLQTLQEEHVAQERRFRRNIEHLLFEHHEFLHTRLRTSAAALQEKTEENTLLAAQLAKVTEERAAAVRTIAADADLHKQRFAAVRLELDEAAAEFFSLQACSARDAEEAAVAAGRAAAAAVVQEGSAAGWGSGRASPLQSPRGSSAAGSDDSGGGGVLDEGGAGGEAEAEACRSLLAVEAGGDTHMLEPHAQLSFSASSRPSGESPSASQQVDEVARGVRFSDEQLIGTSADAGGGGSGGGGSGKVGGTAAAAAVDPAERSVRRTVKKRTSRHHAGFGSASVSHRPAMKKRGEAVAETCPHCGQARKPPQGGAGGKLSAQQRKQQGGRGGGGDLHGGSLRASECASDASVRSDVPSAGAEGEQGLTDSDGEEQRAEVLAVHRLFKGRVARVVADRAGPGETVDVCTALSGAGTWHRGVVRQVLASGEVSVTLLETSGVGREVTVLRAQLRAPPACDTPLSLAATVRRNKQLRRQLEAFERDGALPPGTVLTSLGGVGGDGGAIGAGAGAGAWSAAERLHFADASLTMLSQQADRVEAGGGRYPGAAAESLVDIADEADMRAEAAAADAAAAAAGSDRALRGEDRLADADYRGHAWGRVMRRAELLFERLRSVRERELDSRAREIIAVHSRWMSPSPVGADERGPSAMSAEYLSAQSRPTSATGMLRAGRGEQAPLDKERAVFARHLMMAAVSHVGGALGDANPRKGGGFGSGQTRRRRSGNGGGGARRTSPNNPYRAYNPYRRVDLDADIALMPDRPQTADGACWGPRSGSPPGGGSGGAAAPPFVRPSTAEPLPHRRFRHADGDMPPPPPPPPRPSSATPGAVRPCSAASFDDFLGAECLPEGRRDMRAAGGAYTAHSTGRQHPPTAGPAPCYPFVLGAGEDDRSMVITAYSSPKSAVQRGVGDESSGDEGRLDFATTAPVGGQELNEFARMMRERFGREAQVASRSPSPVVGTAGLARTLPPDEESSGAASREAVAVEKKAHPKVPLVGRLSSSNGSKTARARLPAPPEADRPNSARRYPVNTDVKGKPCSDRFAPLSPRHYDGFPVCGRSFFFALLVCTTIPSQRRPTSPADHPAQQSTIALL